MITRRKSIPINIGKITIGGDAPIVVQSMTSTDTRDVRSTIEQIKELEDLGCELVRVAVPDQQASDAISLIKKNTSLPIIADIHFDYRLAIAAINSGADGLRLNPGNMRNQKQIISIVRKAKERDIPIRIGLNAGSLPKLTNSEFTVSQQMVEEALKHVRLFESLNFNLIKISLKAFDIETTIQAYIDIANKIPYPLHIGITESGPPKTGIIRSSIGIGVLLYLGIGDTIRVSLSAHPREEVIAGYEILKSLNLRQYGPVLISCPSCGRTEVDIINLVKKVEYELSKIKKPVKVAVMGCVVNGPGEAKDADIGLACGKGRGILFKKGRKIGIVDENIYVSTLMKEIETL